MFPYRRFLLIRENYPEDWNELRKLVYCRDGWQCQRCGVKNTEIHAHHLIPLSLGGSNDISNLITLCKNCHIDDHPNMWWGRWKENNPRALLSIRVIAAAALTAFLIISGFSWLKVLFLIVLFRILF